MSVGVLEDVVKMLNSLLLDDKVSTALITKVLNEINKLNVSTNYWCNLSSEPYTQDVCDKFKVLMHKLVESSVKNVVVRMMNNEVSLEQDTIGNILTIFAKISEMLKHAILGSVIVYNGRILCRVKKAFHVRHSIALPGYTILIPIEYAVVLASLGYIDLIDTY